MPNLLKQQYITNESQTRIINSNNQLQQLKEKMEQLQDSSQDQADKDGFTQGLLVQKVETVSPEQLLEDASTKAEKILEDARQQATQIIEEAQNQQQEIFDNAKESAQREGESETALKLEQEKQSLERSWNDKSTQMKAQYDEKYHHMEQDLVETILTVFEKVFRMQLLQQKDVLLHLIENTLLHVESGTSFVVYVCPKQYKELADRLDEIVAQTGKSIEVKLLSDPGLSNDQCRIESDYGIFPCGVDVHYQNLVEQMKQLSE